MAAVTGQPRARLGAVAHLLIIRRIALGATSRGTTAGESSKLTNLALVAGLMTNVTAMGLIRLSG
jgi:hypothetical protein